MRGVLRALLVLSALGLGVAASCYSEEFLLGAWCVKEENCGGDQCCDNHRCRPDGPGFCVRGPDPQPSTPFMWAYRSCQSDDECLVYGMRRCVQLDGAPAGFCADFCYGDPEYCETHPQSSSRVCLELDDEKICALRCCSDGCPAGDGPCAGECPDACPEDMQCLADVCVPKASS